VRLLDVIYDQRVVISHLGLLSGMGFIWPVSLFSRYGRRGSY